MAQQGREESNLSDYKKWKSMKSQVNVPVKPQNNDVGNNAEWLKNQTPQAARISTGYTAGQFFKNLYKKQLDLQPKM